MKEILNAQSVEVALEQLYQAVIDQLPTDLPIAVIGIRTRGEVLASRIFARLVADRPKLRVHYGVLDIGFYRDDLSRLRGAPMVRATEIDFDLDDTWVLLIDDVLQTGRSVRAGLQALLDFGRPKVIRLGVLVDRGGRELPIAADFVGQAVDAPAGCRVQVRLMETDGEENVHIVKQD
ncbi:MAG: bifunctional pyr operon transcriptional regulator/uracil phosphoribosyltransferase PyrR [Planctomycetota bacterium]|jgi:pyrimidine operon attenuation protein/uracil phosphoribosyltransferase